MVGALVVAGGTIMVAGEIVSVDQTVVIVIKYFDVSRALLAAAAAVDVVPTAPPAVAVTTNIPTVAFSRFFPPAPIVGVIIVPPIVLPMFLCRIVSLLLHH